MLDTDSPLEQSRIDGQQVARAGLITIPVDLAQRLLDDAEFRSGVRDILESRPWLFRAGVLPLMKDNSPKQLLLATKAMVGGK